MPGHHTDTHFEYLRDDEAFQELLRHLAEIADLQSTAALLGWDEQVMMPGGGRESRADQKATLQRLIHERRTSERMGELLELLADRELPYDSDEASLIRVTRREYQRLKKVPQALVVELSRAASDGYHCWLKARQDNDFRVFQPALERIYQLHRELADALGYEEHPLDALVDAIEPGLRTADLERIFDALRTELVPMVRTISQHLDRVDDSILRQHFERNKQLLIGRKAVEKIGFDFHRGRQDISVHPFTIALSPADVRYTTRVNEHDFAQCFFACLHEGGHALYAQGIPERFRRTPLRAGASAGFHESQSRLWENLVGRSLQFWEYFLPEMKEVFPTQMKDASAEMIYRAVNKVQPSLIRVEADEVTYNLHIMLRFELEKAVYDAQLTIADLADAWRDKMRSYLGVEPSSDLEGILQDIHWSGRFGACFQSYTLGNIIAAQLYCKVLEQHPDLPEYFRKGDFSPLLSWIREKIHAHGAKFTPEELLLKATGERLTTRPYLDYLKTKYSQVYNVEL